MKETTKRFMQSIILVGVICAIGWMADAIEMQWLTVMPFGRSC